MPNQNNTDPSQTSSDTPVGVPVSPSIFPQSDLPPLPPDFQNVVVNNPVTTTTTTTVSKEQVIDNGSAAPILGSLPPVISSSPKKKFGGGRIIATILGILLLVGGVGTGVYLTQQNQNIKEKAATLVAESQQDTCKLINYGADEFTACPLISKSSGNKNNISTYAGQYRIANMPDDGKAHTVTYQVVACYCTEPYGQYLAGAGQNGNGIICSSDCQTVEKGTKNLVDNGQILVRYSRPSTSGQACGSWQTDLFITAVDGDTNCHGQYSPTANSICQTGNTCSSSTASCQNVKAYNSEWTLLTEAQLSALAPNAIVNFCVAGNLSSGNFDRAEFKIGDATKTSVTTPSTRPGATNEYCQTYTIKVNDSTVSVKARIHHATLGWFGETI